MYFVGWLRSNVSGIAELTLLDHLPNTNTNIGSLKWHYGINLMIPRRLTVYVKVSLTERCFQFKFNIVNVCKYICRTELTEKCLMVSRNC